MDRAFVNMRFTLSSGGHVDIRLEGASSPELIDETIDYLTVVRKLLEKAQEAPAPTQAGPGGKEQP